MLHSYLKTALRYLIKRKAYAFMNIFGLAMGLAVCLVIWKYVEFELSYDSFHKHGDHIYRTLFTDYVNGEKVGSSPRFGYGLGPALLEDLPEVKTYVRTHGIGGDQAVISYHPAQDKFIRFQEENIQFVDSTFLDVFTYDLILGNPSTALDNPSSVVLTASAAKRYFGNGVNPIGKTLSVFTSYWVKGDYEVTAVMNDVPANSHFAFEFLIPIHNLLQIEGYQEPRAEWDWVNFITYVEMYPGTDVQRINAKTDELLSKYTGPNEPGTFIFTFEPLRQIHLADESETPFNSIYFFVLISIIILSIAWINYINLSTSRATERAREVCVKKALGVSKRQLITQFMTESCLINFLSLATAVVLALALLPLVRDMTGKLIRFDFTEPRMWFLLTGLFFVGSFASGVYPAFVLSSFQATNIMKGNVHGKRRGLPFRKALVVFQFATSLLLLMGTFTVYRQINFMQDHEKGLSMDRMLVVNGPRILDEKDGEFRLLAFKNELLNYAGIKSVTTSGSVPGGGFNLVTGIVKLGIRPENNQIPTGYIVRSDFDFPTAYEFELISGRLLDPAITSDFHSVLINEEALGTFNLGNAENALYERLLVDEEDTVAIVGVFKNVHWSSLQTPHVPMLLWPHTIFGKHFSIRLNEDITRSMAAVEELYERHFPGNPFDYYFLDDSFNQQYKGERQFGKIISLFSLLAIIIACLGLSALASFAAIQRSKEISIRKVLGASIENILRLLTWQYLRLMVMSCAIAFPLSMYVMNAWLNNFAFRVNLSWDLYIIPVLVLFVVAIGTVSLQAIKAAVENPVNNLRCE